MLKNFKPSELLHSGIAGFAAKSVASGIFKKFAQTWTIDGFVLAQEQGKGFINLFEVAPEWANTIKGALKKYPNLRGVSANELLSWVQDGNPILFSQICAKPDLVAWIFKEWEIAKTELLA